MRLIGKIVEVSLDRYAKEAPTPTRVCIEFDGKDASGQKYGDGLVIYTRNHWNLGLNDTVALELGPVEPLGETAGGPATGALAATN